MTPIHLLTGPAAQCPVPRELMFDLAADMRADKPLWAWDDAFEAIDAMEDAGAAVVQGEIVAVSASGEVSRVPWEQWMEGAPLPEYPPPRGDGTAGGKRTSRGAGSPRGRRLVRWEVLLSAAATSSAG